MAKKVSPSQVAKEKERERQRENQQAEMVGLDIGKVPPQAIDMEEAVLGALLLEPDTAIDTVGALRAEFFYKECNRIIFEAIANLVSRRDPVDIYTVSEELKKEDKLDQVGGVFYLSQLSLRVAAASHVEYHSKVLTQKYIQRELITTSYKILKDAFDDTIPADDLLNESQQRLFELGEMNLRRDSRPVRNILDEVVKDLHEVTERTDGLSGLASGYASLDRITLGWQKGDLIIVAARPSMGKTAFTLTMARNMSVINHTPVAFFSLEMPDVQLVKRLLVSETGLAADQIKGGRKMEEHDWVQLESRVHDLVNAPLYIDDTPSMSIMEFRSKARRLVNGKGVKIIIIDYMQLMVGPPELRGMREQEVAAISRSLKAVAKELNVPVIALSQMNRASEMRSANSKRPQLSDLRESGSIEQDADIVIFISRPEKNGIFEDPETQLSTKGVAEIIIAKHRNGETGDIKMQFRDSEIRFLDYNDDVGADFATDPQSFGRYASKMNLTNPNAYDE